MTDRLDDRLLDVLRDELELAVAIELLVADHLGGHVARRHDSLEAPLGSTAERQAVVGRGAGVAQRTLRM